jgi:hypothetical protein
MNKILIVSKTKMENEKVCVGGIDLSNSMSVRLLDRNGSHESKEDCPYNIKEIWNIEYIRYPRPLPHSEDIRVVSRTKSGVLIQDMDISILDVLKKINFKIYSGNIRETFEGKLNCTDSGSLYISVENVPQNSTCFWICDREITRRDFQMKVRYNYYDRTRQRGYYIAYVGLESPAQIIPQGTLVRLSLAHWWSPHSENEERCYLQLSGWY